MDRCFSVLVLTDGFYSRHLVQCSHPGEGGSPYNGLYREAPPDRDTFFRLLVYKREGISKVEEEEKAQLICYLVI